MDYKESPPQTSAQKEPLARREKVVLLDDGETPIVVREWSYSKTLAILKHLAQIINEVSPEDMGKLQKGSPLESAATLIEVLGDRVIGLMRLSVSAEDESHITGELSALDVLSLLEAILEVNGDFLKKAKVLLTKFRR